jgi:hypothetical protein
MKETSRFGAATPSVIRPTARGDAGPRWTFDELTFEPPRPERVDALFLVVRDPSSGTRTPATITVTREAAPEETLEAYCFRKVADMMRESPGTKLMEDGAFDVRGRRASLLRFAWPSQLGTTEQILVMLEVGADAERRILCFNATAPAAQIEAAERSLMDMVASIEFPADAAERPPAVVGDP